MNCPKCSKAMEAREWGQVITFADGHRIDQRVPAWACSSECPVVVFGKEDVSRFGGLLAMKAHRVEA